MAAAALIVPAAVRSGRGDHILASLHMQACSAMSSAKQVCDMLRGVNDTGWRCATIRVEVYRSYQ